MFLMKSTKMIPNLSPTTAVKQNEKSYERFFRAVSISSEREGGGERESFAKAFVDAWWYSGKSLAS